MSSPSYKGLRPASQQSSAAARGSSAKQDTRCETVLRSALWRMGLRFRKNVATLPGKPDIVFPSAKVVVFCDGDFWHGRNWQSRKKKLRSGSNPVYWIRKIESNKARDRRRNQELSELGWSVIRVWETDIVKDTKSVALKIHQEVVTCLARQ